MKVALDGRRGKIRRKRVNVFSPKRLSTGSHAPPFFRERFGPSEMQCRALRQQDGSKDRQWRRLTPAIKDG